MMILDIAKELSEMLTSGLGHYFFFGLKKAIVFVREEGALR